MRTRGKKERLFAIFAIVLLMASAIVMLNVPVKAQTEVPVSGPLPSGATPSVTIAPVAHMSFRPNPVGLGQTFLVNLWTTPAVAATRNHPNYTVTITKPDETVDVLTMPSYKADATAWFEYIADQVGEWKLRFYFPGTYFNGTRTTQSAYYSSTSTAEQTLTVQQNIVYSWPESPLPTDYWTRPVHVENREWWAISGNWPGTGYVGGGDVWDKLYPNTCIQWSDRHKFTPWVQGPESAHILWKRQEAIAGIIGGQAGYYGLTSGGFGGAPGTPSVIYSGRVYDSYTKPGLGSSTSDSTMFRCYDLRTGEVYWEYPTTTTQSGGFFGGSTGLVPNLVEYIAPTQSEVTGAEAAGTWSVNLMRIQGSQLYKWNPWTGAMTLNVSISPATSAVFYRQPSKRGELPLALSVVGGRLINWTTSGTGTLASRIKSNTSYAMSSLPSLIDFEAGLGASVGGITKAGVYTGETLTGYDLLTGQTLWTKNISEPMYSFVCDLVDHGKLATLSANGYYLCYDLRTGKQLWKSTSMAYPWSSSGFGGYTAMSAYGMIYREAYDGIYAFYWDNGTLAWKYSSPAGSAYETPYINEKGTTVMPFYSFGVGGQIADGKFYTWNYEHTESWPVTRGWSLHCIDCFTGKGVWNLTGCATPTAIADGYLVATNSYDGYTYFIGKGKSATTVTAGPKAIAQGEKVVIEGTVLDLSPAQPNTPCVSVDSMKTQMDYLHMQLPIAGIWNNVTMVGVPVYLTAADPNGNAQTIGTAISNAYTGAFSMTYTPEIEGDYTIMATFAGDASYSSSGASTAITVGPAPTTAPTAPPAQAPTDYMPMMYALLAVGIIAIVLMLVLLFRKKQ